MTYSYNLLNEATVLMNCVLSPLNHSLPSFTLFYSFSLSAPLIPSFPPLALCRVLMESHSNDSRDSGHHWWNSSYSYITPYHRSTVLL